MTASDLISKKLLAGPTLAAPLLLTGQLTGWQFTVIVGIYLVAQGVVDVLCAARDCKPDAPR